MEKLKGHIDELAEIMDEFKLAEAELAGEGWRVSFRRRPKENPAGSHAGAPVYHDEPSQEEPVFEPPQPTAPKGTPVTSPMTGIYYGAPNPSAPPFVREGDSVTAGDVVGLIEAMKVFNEIVAPLSGTVTKTVAASGQIVNPGDALLYIG